MEVILAYSDDGMLYYIKVHGNNGYEFITDMRHATKFGAMCSLYIEEILAYLYDIFPTYRFERYSITSLCSELSFDGNIFDRESFELKY